MDSTNPTAEPSRPTPSVDHLGLSQEHHTILSQYANGIMTAELVSAWPTMRPVIKQCIRTHAKAYDTRTPPVLHKAAPLAQMMRESQGADEPRSAAFDLVMSEHEIQPEDLQDFYPARTPPPSETWPSWDVVLDGQDLERVCEHICAFVDEFDEAPPFTIQRLAELVLDPARYYHTRSKFLGALRRVLCVTGMASVRAQYACAEDDARPSQPGDLPANDSLTATSTTNPSSNESPFRMRTGSDAQLYAPLPFPLPAHDSEPPTSPTKPSSDAKSTGLPAGLVDEFDSSSQHGTVSGTMHPLSATTQVDIPEKRPRSS